MRQIFIIFLLILSSLILNAKAPRKPFVVLRINGKEYKSGSYIDVRPGEIIEIEAVLLGGRRDYCANPQVYANVGANTTITSQGENGMSFYIGDGTFRGTWSLTSEKAVFSAGTGAIITPVAATGNKNNIAKIEIPKSGYGQVFITVNMTTDWHYVRFTQAGRSEQNETNKGKGTFYFKIQQEEGVWYSSANLSAKGVENFSVRNSLDRVQRSYDDIKQQILNKNFSNIDMYVNNLKNSVSDLKSTIENEKSKDANFECEVTFIGLPTTETMKHIKAFETLSVKWREQYLICQDNVSKINDMLLKVRTGLSTNILRSVFKNYINWGTSIPTSYPDFLTLYDPSSALTVASLPAKVMGWWTDANNDASILKNQFQTIQMLSTLQNFYMDRMTKSVDERQKVQDLIRDLEPVKQLDSQLKNYFMSQTWANFQY